MTTVSVRIDPAVLEEARKYGINVSEALRQGLEAELRKARMIENVRHLEKLAKSPTRPTISQLRSLRDGDRS